MSSANKFVDDFSRVFSSAAGVAQGAMKEAENTMKGFTQKWVDEQGYVSREEFDAIAEMAKNARAENAELRKEIEAIKAELSKKKSTTKKS